MHISLLIKKYENRGKIGLNNYLKYYKTLGNINTVITYAALAISPDGKKHTHQKRLKNQVMNNVMNRLLGQAQIIAGCSNFDDLIKIVTNASEKGFRELAIYDTALRIGSYMNIYPNKVYLHAGTLEGAKTLGIKGKCRTINPKNLPGVFHRLKAYEIEDFLCIYKKQLKIANNKIVRPNNIRIKKPISI